MDPPALMNDEPYNLEEIWHFPMNGNGRGHLGESSRDLSGNDPVGLKQRMGHGGRKRRDAEQDSGKGVSTSNANASNNGVNNYDGKRIKALGGRDENCDSKAEAEPPSGKPVEQNTQPPEPPKQDYIHVRARRGQATDSHSLAERARREKISERMKILQDLVPGCNKVIGKALVLDEIINYIQSLQRQVEFLSMKLEAVNSRMTPGIEVFPSKDFGPQAFDTTGLGFASQAAREYSRGASPEWLHMQWLSKYIPTVLKIKDRPYFDINISHGAVVAVQKTAALYEHLDWKNDSFAPHLLARLHVVPFTNTQTEPLE